MIENSSSSKQLYVNSNYLSFVTDNAIKKGEPFTMYHNIIHIDNECSCPIDSQRERYKSTAEKENFYFRRGTLSSSKRDQRFENTWWCMELQGFTARPRIWIPKRMVWAGSREGINNKMMSIQLGYFQIQLTD